MGPFLPLSCILLKFYIKPQHSWRPHDRPFVVSYWNSTSNHNSFEIIMVIRRLYLIEILHQTTTYSSPLSLLLRCILLKFYIKPQRGNSGFLPEVVVSYWNSTSNHNTSKPFNVRPVVVSYWNSTSNHNSSLGCVWVISVVSYWNSTSNHNLLQEFVNCWRLYLIEILHQTTTCGKCEECLRRCILLKFYIKPQRSILSTLAIAVVSYWNSTSNHNSSLGLFARRLLYLIEILHQTTTFWLQ